jgi:TRAP-type C4-dicarboxylate transport system permease large subunit
MCTIGLISPPTGMTVFVIQAQHPEIPAVRIYLDVHFVNPMPVHSGLDRV